MHNILLKDRFRNSVFGRFTMPQAGQPSRLGLIPESGKNFMSCPRCPYSPSFSMITETPFSRVKWPVCAADQQPQFSVTIKNERNYTSAHVTLWPAQGQVRLSDILRKTCRTQLQNLASSLCA